jgi:xanthine dehydrogenase small subunit
MQRDMLRFLLNGELQEVRGCAPDLTVLRYLREQRRLTGSKEGCAEGDCGACTAVLVEAVNGALRYQAVNTCILFLPMLDGRELITVEALAGPDGLHPVQTAMVKQHGSQCGFCTPGFVMSLFTLYHQAAPAPPTRRALDVALAGNLCRCTGYAPIVRAAEAALPGRADHFSTSDPQRLARLEALSTDDLLELEDGGRRYFAPTTLAALCALLKQYPEATLVAGATDVGLWVTKQLRQLDTVIYTGRVAQLRRLAVDEAAQQLLIGAAVTYTEAQPAMVAHYPEWDELLTRLGAVQVRNLGTIGGNIANGSPIGDTPPGLIALGARLVLAAAGGSREIPLEDYFIRYGEQDLRPGECVALVKLPLPRKGQQFRTYKLSKRIEQDISAVCAGFYLDLDGSRIERARVCYGGMAETPRRAPACEAALNGATWDEATLAAAMAALRKDFEPISDMRASAAYRQRAAGNLLRRFYLETRGAPYPVRLSSRYPEAAGEAAGTA